MNLYTHDLSILDFDFPDHIIDYSLTVASEEPTQCHSRSNLSPPKHRHDGTSPLPLGMEWSPPPLKWDGLDSVWPHDSHTGWSYCITIPSWIILPKSSGSESSDNVVFYRVQVGIQSPDGITTTRAILRRFNEFLKLFSELKKAFPHRNLPPAPSKQLLRLKTNTLLQERKCFLEDWMQKLLYDIDISRSVPVAIFLELEAAARSSFDDMNDVLDATNSALQDQTQSDLSVVAAGSIVASDYGDDSTDEKSETGILRVMDSFSKLGKNQAFEKTYRTTALHGDEMEIPSEMESGNGNLTGHIRKPSTESVGSDISSLQASEISTFGVANFDNQLHEGSESGTVDSLASASLQFSSDILVALPLDEQHKMKRVLFTVQHRLATARTDMEELIARLNQELAVRQYLTTKVKDLEVELETTKQNCNDGLQQAILIEKERVTQMQWDVEELRRKCLEMELQLKAEQDEKCRMELTSASIIQENQMLLKELDFAREQHVNLQKHHEEFEGKSKADVKLLVKEVKSLRSSHTELKQELGRIIKEQIEAERVIQKEKKRRELADIANVKLLHECEILRERLQECSVSFAIEEDDRLNIDASSPYDAIDLLTTSDNRIGLLLAEAQLLAQDVESAVADVDKSGIGAGDDTRTTDDQMRKMLTDIFVDNAILRKQVNSVIRCAMNKPTFSDNDEEEEKEEEIPLRKTVLSKLLER